MTTARHRDAAAGVVVVPIAPAHAASFHAALDEVAREQRYLAQTAAPPLAKIEGFVRDGVAADAVQFVALDGERVVGWADVFPDWPASTAHRGHLGMGVLAAWRGRGIGRRLIGAALDAAQARFEQVDLDVYAGNAAAHRLYRAAGFVEQGRKRGGRKLDGAYDDIILMTRFFKEPA